MNGRAVEAGIREPSGRSSKSSAAGRQLILDHAARLFRADGYAATSLRDIADACGMKAGSLYYHFASKDAIVGEVLKIGVERVGDVVRAAVAALPADSDARTLLHTAVRAHLSALLELQDYTSANVRIVGQVPAEVRTAHIATRDAYERFWSQLLKRCAKQGGFDDGRDLKLARLFLIGALNGSLEWFRGGPVGVDRIAAELSTLFLDGLVSRPAAAKPRKKKSAR
jgi:AcrR family transcriptional regulator